MDRVRLKITATTLLFLAVCATAGCAENVRLCRDGDFRTSQYHTRAELVETVRFVQYCIAFDQWGWFYDTLSKQTRDNIPWIIFWFEIESIKWPDTDRYLTGMLKSAEIWGVVKKSARDAGDIKKVAIASGNIGGEMWLVDEKGRLRFALWEMLEHLKEHGSLN